MSLDGSQPQLQYTITQTMDELLLTEIAQGRFKNFRTYLKEREIVQLELPWQTPPNLDLALLSQALQDTHVTTVNLRNNHHIGDARAIGFARNLKGTNVTTVNLPYNQISDEGAIGFAEHLKDTNVTTVDLRGNGVGPEGAIGFAQNLKGTNVTTVNLTGNQLGPKGAIGFAQHLKSTNVTAVDLSHNQVGNAGAIGFAEHLKDTNVTTVDLALNEIGPEGATGFAQHLKDTNVTTVVLRANQIGPEGAIGFAQNLKGTNVTTVDLRNNYIGPEGAKGFTQRLKDTNVTTVDLRANHIGPKGEWTLKRALEIQRYLAPYVVMQAACNTRDKKEITLTRLRLNPQDDAGAFAREIIKKLPNELAAKVAGYLIKKEKNITNLFTHVARYELRPKHNSPFSPLMSFLIQENNHKRTQTQTKEPPAKRRKLTD